jgi:D-inositol-3-phosphate glycosyltransferase
MCRIAMLSVHTCPLATLGGKETGGMNVYVRELTRELGRRGKQVDVFTRAVDSTIAPVRHMGPNARVIHVPAGPVGPYDKNGIYRHLDEFVAGVEAFRREEGIHYDLVHAHYWLSGVAGETLARRWGVPLAQMFHTLGQMKNEVAKAPRDREVALRIEEETRLVDVADRIIAPTSTERAQLAWYYGADPEKISVIPCGVDTRLFRPRDQAAARQRLSLPEGRLLLFVGRIERLKGIDTLLEATSLLLARPGYEDLRVLIVGGDLESTADNPEQQRVRQLARDLGVAGRVDFLGAQSQAELAYFYAAADLTIMPSHYESFGMVALESMACGTPVVASRVGGLALLVKDGETGILVPEEAPTTLAMQTHAILQDDAERRAMGARAAAYAKDFAWGRIADRIVDLYDDLIHDAGRRGCPCVM